MAKAARRAPRAAFATHQRGRIMPTRNDLRQNDDINRIANALDRIVTLLEPFAATPENTPPDPDRKSVV